MLDVEAKGRRDKQSRLFTGAWDKLSLVQIRATGHAAWVQVIVED